MYEPAVKAALDTFGSALMAEVRDRVGNVEWLKADPNAQKIISGMTHAQLQELVLRVVDESLFKTLFLFEERSSDLSVEAQRVDLATASDGLSGELFGGRGWIARFSNLGFSDSGDGDLSAD